MTRDELHNICLEGDQIRSRHDGIHDVHGASYALWAAVDLLDVRGYLDDDDVKNIEYIIRTLRIADKKGHWLTQAEQKRIKDDLGITA